MVESTINTKPEAEATNVWGDDIGGEQQKKKCKAFTDWCEKVGIEYPDQEYPAFFERDLVGVKAKKEIKFRQSFLKVPHKCLISINEAGKHKVLGPVIKASPEVFSEEEQTDANQMILTLYLMYEWQLGEKSFWKPYLDMMPDD